MDASRFRLRHNCDNFCGFGVSNIFCLYTFVCGIESFHKNFCTVATVEAVVLILLSTVST